jgi:hypothetical protein
MKTSDLTAAAAKLELAHKNFRMTFALVEPQWTDAARRDFQETHLEPMDANVRKMVEAVTRLAAVFAAAERDCGDQ